MQQLIRYTIQGIFNPGWGDFMRMGMGIAARERRCRAYWRPHLELCKEFQRSAFPLRASERTLTVLGAGQLFDLDTELLSRFHSINLCDANPLVRPAWSVLSRRLSSRQKLNCFIEDVTFALQNWSAALELFLQSSDRGDVKALCAFLEDLRCPRVDRPWLESGVILSLNLLSQLPLYWRDRVHLAVLHAWGLDTGDDGEYSAPLQRALLSSFHEIQAKHLELLRSSAADLVVLISDTDFMYYTSQTSHWQVSPAVYLSGRPAIEGFSEVLHSQWHWHIAPQGVEQPEFGVIHNVLAQAFVRD